MSNGHDNPKKPPRWGRQLGQGILDMLVGLGTAPVSVPLGLANLAQLDPGLRPIGEAFEGALGDITFGGSRKLEEFFERDRPRGFVEHAARLGPSLLPVPRAMRGAQMVGRRGGQVARPAATAARAAEEITPYPRAVDAFAQISQMLGRQMTKMEEDLFWGAVRQGIDPRELSVFAERLADAESQRILGKVRGEFDLPPTALFPEDTPGIVLEEHTKFQPGKQRVENPPAFAARAGIRPPGQTPWKSMTEMGRRQDVTAQSLIRRLQDIDETSAELGVQVPPSYFQQMFESILNALGMRN